MHGSYVLNSLHVPHFFGGNDITDNCSNSGTGPSPPGFVIVIGLVWFGLVCLMTSWTILVKYIAHPTPPHPLLCEDSDAVQGIQP